MDTKTDKEDHVNDKTNDKTIDKNTKTIYANRLAKLLHEEEENNKKYKNTVIYMKRG